MTGFTTIVPDERLVPRPGETSYRILMAVAQKWKGSNFGPTVEELRQEVGLSSRSGVQFHVSNLLDAGWLDNIPNRRRTLKLTDKGRRLIRVFDELADG
jgi:DNA-binding MarR family transcriptional regulator